LYSERARTDIVGHRVHLPEGYGLFSHLKPQAEGKIREDVYLFGSRHAIKVSSLSYLVSTLRPNKSQFRSPNEFIPHVDWLLSSSNVDDHSTVTLFYFRGNKIFMLMVVRVSVQQRISSTCQAQRDRRSFFIQTSRSSGRQGT
jgi:hypothetical protein